jgi:23S rRNA (guanine2445-N2)-methyltransferase / 23S rRNA (guanine2069-N7)-methyltransferase
MKFFATAPKGLEYLLVDELKALGATTAAEKLAGVAFEGDLSTAYRACLWSRLANRILMPIADVEAPTPEALYAGVQSIAWDQHLAPDATLAVHFVSVQSAITHTLFGAQKVKDAIVDQFRDKYNERPSVAKASPDLAIYVYLHRDIAHISLDLSGESLHRRGYRLSQVEAPLKENLAAAVLLRSQWPSIAKNGGSLMDPMCGSGTLLIEAAWMAADRAPGLTRSYFGFIGWKQHQPKLWEALLAEAQTRFEAGIKTLPSIIGYDHDPAAIKSSFENLERAGLLTHVHVERRELETFAPAANIKHGLVVCNPPYGERLGEEEALRPLYTLLGDRLKQGFEGWRASVLTSNPDLGKVMGLRSKKQYALFNGALPSQLLLFDVEAPYFVDRSPEAENERRIRAATRAITDQDRAHVEMFANRLTKNFKHHLKQSKGKADHLGVIYDADLPEYAFHIEIKSDGVLVQEYLAPRSIDKEKVLKRRQAALSVIPGVLGVEAAHVYFEPLIRRKGDEA